MSRQHLIAWALVALAASGPLPAPAGDGATTATAQTSRQGGVIFTVAPGGFPRGAATWDFAVTLETHTESLDDDLMQATTLIADGKAYRPLGWDGPPPGGHHRKGVLRFKAVRPLPETVELQVRRPGETHPRVFRWRTSEHP